MKGRPVKKISPHTMTYTPSMIGGDADEVRSLRNEMTSCLNKIAARTYATATDTTERGYPLSEVGTILNLIEYLLPQWEELRGLLMKLETEMKRDATPSPYRVTDPNVELTSHAAMVLGMVLDHEPFGITRADILRSMARHRWHDIDYSLETLQRLGRIVLDGERYHLSRALVTDLSSHQRIRDAKLDPPDPELIARVEALLADSSVEPEDYPIQHPKDKEQ